MGFNSAKFVLNSANRIYNPGQLLSGTLVFNLEKVTTCRSIYVKVNGSCRVRWQEYSSRTLNTFESDESYIKHKIFIVRDEHEKCTLQPGRYELPFQCLIPNNCPSSFEGKYGHIRYGLEAVMDRSFAMNSEIKMAFKVIRPLDLNADPYCREPMEIECQTLYCCCCMCCEFVGMQVKLPVSGYCPGQIMPIEIISSSKTTRKIDKIKLAIVEKCKYYGTDFFGRKTKENQRTSYLAEIDSIPAREAYHKIFTIEVPQDCNANLSTCKNIDLDYYLQVILCVSGCHTNDDFNQKIIFGTIPLVDVQNDAQNNHTQTAPVAPVVVQPLHSPAGNSPYPPGTHVPTNPRSSYPAPSPIYPGVHPPAASRDPPPYSLENTHPGFTPSLPTVPHNMGTRAMQPSAPDIHPTAPPESAEIDDCFRDRNDSLFD